MFLWICYDTQMYRVSHVLVDLGWVDFDLGASPIFPSYPAASAKFPSAQAELCRQRNTHISSQPNPVHKHMGVCEICSQ